MMAYRPQSHHDKKIYIRGCDLALLAPQRKPILLFISSLLDPNGEVNGQEIPHLCVRRPRNGPPVACSRDALDHDPDPVASPYRGRRGRRLDSEPLRPRITGYQ